MRHELEDGLEAAARGSRPGSGAGGASSDYGDDVIRLALANCVLEVRLTTTGAFINVRRETGVVDLLYVERGTVVDGKRNRISSVEGYFGGLVVDLAADPAC